MAKNRSHSSEGPSQRQLRVGELIRRTLADVLARGDIHDPDLNRYSITVGEVRTSPDLKIATAYVLPLGGKGRDEIIELLARNPARLLGVNAGDLAPRYEADIVLIDPDKPWIVDSAKMSASAGNTPFDGQPTQSRATALWKGGVRLI